MPRPRKPRTVCGHPRATYFKPAGIPLRELEEIQLAADELEAVRLADLELLYHDAAARRMQVSRQTFGRILRGARRRIAMALVSGAALRLEPASADTEA